MMNNYMMNQNMINQNIMNNNMLNQNLMNINDKNKEIYEDILKLINIRKNQFKNNNQNGEKIIINFYNNLLVINLDLRIYIRKLIENVCSEILGDLIQNKIWKRQSENKTTEDVIKIQLMNIKE